MPKSCYITIHIKIKLSRIVLKNYWYIRFHKYTSNFYIFTLLHNFNKQELRQDLQSVNIGVCAADVHKTHRMQAGCDSPAPRT